MVIVEMAGVFGESHEVLPSTQKQIKQHLRDGVNLEHRFFVMSVAQTEGRGRAGNIWNSIPGNLHCSIYLKKIPFGQITWIPMWVSVCVFRALNNIGLSEKLYIKWPNDIWNKDSKKLCGILCEKVESGMVVGIGINITASPAMVGGTVPFNSRPSATTVLKGILNQLNQETTLEELREIYIKNSLFHPEQQLTWRDEKTGEIKAGTMVEIGKMGELIVSVNGENVSLFTENVSGVRSIPS